jgi:uncharacterized protein DUF4175
MSDAGLRDFVRRVESRRQAGNAAIAGAAAVLLGALAWRGGLPPAAAAGAGLVVAAAVLCLSLVSARRNPVSLLDAARHFDRTCPELEESTELLLIPPDDLGWLERLQRERVAQRASRSSVAVPSSLGRRALIAAGWMAATAALVVLVPNRRPPAGQAPHGPAAAVAAAHTVLGARIVVTPPAYTRRPARVTTDWDLDAEEGAAIRWEITVADTAGLAGRPLVTSAGDTARFEARSGGAVAAELIARQSTLYRALLPGVDADRRLTVRPDRPPTVTVETPAERTELPADSRPRIPVSVVIDDDYGVMGADLRATITRGRGEAVTFHDERLPLALVAPHGPAGGRFGHTLDLARLGLGPGDGLYFHIVARDNRVPEPHETRSGTVFIAVADTAAAPLSDFSGLALSLAPEYFRSQRQIIIDTEKLLADQPRIDGETFRGRSNDLGIDQGLLRMRYGEFVGQEDEEASIAEGDTHHGREQPPPPPTAPPADDKRQQEKPSTEYTHQHDTEENATLLSRTVKEKLKASLAEMWQAELRLRTYRPKEALPFEYRALGLLKEVQQDSRAYVQRVGFDPPPLEPERKRLTGTLTAIHPSTGVVTSAASDSLPAVRLALVRLGFDDRLPPPDLAGTLEAAGNELARLAVADPARHLDGLRRLRRLIGAVESGTDCPACVRDVRVALLRALPPAAPRAASDRAAASSLARRYFDRLDRSP